MKKLLSIFCVLVLIAALLCGCAVTPAPSESTADATTAPTTAATTPTTEATTAATTEATTVAPTTTEATTTVATTAPTTAPVTRPTFDPSIPVATWPTIEGLRHDGSGYFTFEGFEYKVRYSQAEIFRYIGSETDVTIPHEVQYVYKDTLYTEKILDASVRLFLDTSVETVRWHPEVSFSPGSLGGVVSSVTHLYLPLQLGDQERFATLHKVNLISYWTSLTNTSDGGERHLYLIKGAPLTEALADDGLYNPYGWELDFSEEGVYCFYKPIDGKDDQQAVYFHVAESFE